jgi:hypothetical protein
MGKSKYAVQTREKVFTLKYMKNVICANANGFGK